MTVIVQRRHSRFARLFYLAVALGFLAIAGGAALIATETLGFLAARTAAWHNVVV